MTSSRLAPTCHGFVLAQKSSASKVSRESSLSDLWKRDRRVSRGTTPRKPRQSFESSVEIVSLVKDTLSLSLSHHAARLEMYPKSEMYSEFNSEMDSSEKCTTSLCCGRVADKITSSSDAL